MKQTSKLSAFALAAAIASTNSIAMAQDIYLTEQGHTEVIFGWAHANVSKQHGEFTKASGTLTLVNEKLEDSSLDVTIDMSSINTGVVALDDNLKTRSFLFVEKFPEATFKSTSIELTGDKTANVNGDLTLHGVTKPVTLKTTLTHKGRHPVGQFISSFKGEWIAFHATTVLNHQSFGIGGYSTGPIFIEINTELKLQ